MNEKRIVVPGEEIGNVEEKNVGDNVYVINNKIIAKKVGLVKETEKLVNIVPLSGVYIPRRGDKIIGIIEEVEPSGWIVNINSPYHAFLPLAEGVNEFVDIFRTDLSKYYDIGEVIYAKILNIMRKKIIQLTIKEAGLRKLEGGVLVKVSPSKVPRIIGKGGSMVNLIKEKTKCNIIVAQNGLVWIKGKNAEKVISVIKLIERESHISGLTEKVKNFLEGAKNEKTK